MNKRANTAATVKEIQRLLEDTNGPDPMLARESAFILCQMIHQNRWYITDKSQVPPYRGYRVLFCAYPDMYCATCSKHLEMMKPYRHGGPGLHVCIPCYTRARKSFLKK